MTAVEIDNLVYATGISEQWRRRMEEVGHVALDQEAMAATSQMKTIHTVIISIAVPGGSLAYKFTESPISYMLPVMGAMLVAAILDTLLSSGPKARRIGEVTASWMVGMVAFMMIGSVV
eukprot:SAG31_NODE_1626_length_7710_cov_28.409933_3_plen_119_part_00